MNLVRTLLRITLVASVLCFTDIGASEGEEDELDFVLRGIGHHLGLIRDGRIEGSFVAYSSPENGVEICIEGEPTVISSRENRTVEFTTTFRGKTIRMRLEEQPNLASFPNALPDEIVYFDDEVGYRHRPTQGLFEVLDYSARDLMGERYVVPFYSCLLGNVPFLELVRRIREGGWTICARRSNGIAGSPNSYVIEMQDPAQEARGLYWVDPNKGFAVLKIEHWRHRTDKYPALQIENQQIEQISEGVWLPRLVHEMIYSRSQEDSSKMLLTLEAITTYRDIQINVGVKEEDVALWIPYGTDVYDYHTSDSYTVGVEEKTLEEVIQIRARSSKEIEETSGFGGSTHPVEPREHSEGSSPAVPDQDGGFFVTPDRLGLERARDACGPACLFAVCRLLEVDCSLQELVDLAGTRKGHCSFSDLRRAAQRKGLSATGWELTPNGLREVISSGNLAIVYYIPDHFFAVVSFLGDQVEILDPPRRHLIPCDVFAKGWDGKALVISR